MANRFFNPDQQLCDTTGLPYAGGSLTFYASGTTTPLNTYSDKALSIANTNPVVLDSAGRAGSIFLQNLAYKVVLADSNSNVIWTFDPVYASDFSTVAQFQSGNGSPNGSVAGSAGSATIPASSYWDATNNILYVCTQTGTAGTAVWTAVNAASAAAVVPPPQGYLTLTSQTPVIPGDVTASAVVYYTPFVGNLVPIYSGTTFVPTAFSELTLTLTASQSANTIYDVFVFNNSGVITVGTGPAWSNSSAGTGARGTGPGSTQLTRLNGTWTNAVSMTVRNSSSTFTVAANQGTYVGSIFIDGTNGQVSCYRSYGQNRKWGVWNAFNRQPIYLIAGDPTASWNTASATPRPSNGNTANNVTVFAGLAEEAFDTKFNQLMTLATTSTSSSSQVIGIGYNSTSTTSGINGTAQISGTASLTAEFQPAAAYLAPPSLGINVVTSLEKTVSNNAGSSYSGTQAGMQLSAQWRG